jgi:two-component system, NarL family, response regulator LiaR
MSEFVSVEEYLAAAEGHGGFMARVRIFLVDDHQMVSEVLAARLAVTSELWVTGRHTTGDPCLFEAVARGGPDVIVLDVTGIGHRAAELIRRMRSAAPGVHVVALASADDPAIAVGVARAGAEAWIGPDTSLEEFGDVLLSVSRGQACYPPNLLGVVLRALLEDARRARDRDGPLDALSSREQEVLLGMVDGKSGTKMAHEMFLSANTIRTHSRAVLTKLGVHSRLEAVALARAAGMRPSESTRTSAVG